MLTCSHGHHEIWEEWRKGGSNQRSGPASLIATDEYEEWPRGRIVYAPLHSRFVVYADAQILSRPELLRIIREEFKLPSDRTETKRDSHYVSTKRLEG